MSIAMRMAQPLGRRVGERGRRGGIILIHHADAVPGALPDAPSGRAAARGGWTSTGARTGGSWRSMVSGERGRDRGGERHRRRSRRPPPAARPSPAASRCCAPPRRPTRRSCSSTGWRVVAELAREPALLRRAGSRHHVRPARLRRVADAQEKISIAGYGRFVERLLDRLDAGPCVAVGNSMGGFIGAELAIRFPPRSSGSCSSRHGPDGRVPARRARARGCCGSGRAR